MPLEKQVTSLELSKKLKELGVKQESLFYYSRVKHEQEYKLDFGIHGPYETKDLDHKISAFTVAELGEMLPYAALGAYFNQFKGANDWSMGYGLEKTINSDTEAEARGKMLVYLRENKLITL